MITHLCLPISQQTLDMAGVRLFIKNTLPVIVRNDLAFDDSIVVELKSYIEVLLSKFFVKF